MSEHFIEKCPCGIIVSQCRCAEGIGEKKTVRIVKCQHPEPPVTDAYSPDSEWMNASLGQPAMTDHAQIAEQLIEHLGNYPGIGEHFRDEWQAQYDKDISLLMKALTQAHAAGRREGLEEAAKIADQCTYMNPDAPNLGAFGGPGHCEYGCGQAIAHLIRAKAKETGYE